MKKLTWFAFACLSVLILVLGIALWWLIQNYFEMGKPVIRLNQNIQALGQATTVALTCTDRNSGLREIRVSILQDNRRLPVAFLACPGRGVREKKLSVQIDPGALKLREGPAKLQVLAVDYSFFKNETTFEQPFSVDLKPPQVFPLNAINNINPGGACVIVYQTSKPVLITGVRVGEHFFPAGSSSIAGKPVFICYFAMPIDADKRATAVWITAKDQAGNEARSALPFLLKKKKFRSDTMTMGDNFLERKMPEFESLDPSLKGKSPLEIFRFVNEQVRINNEQFIRSLCSTVTPKALWQGAFLRMKNASPMALFGDRRSYLYRGKSIGGSVHLGVDLASTAHVPIEAANQGVVVFTGMLGIYGNAIIIDHGLGLHSLYGHMAAINVKKGQTVKKGEAIGVSGATGLAAGDHLHFSIIVGGQFVNPQEWWDPHWIADNVDKKLEVTP